MSQNPLHGDLPAVRKIHIYDSDRMYQMIVESAEEFAIFTMDLDGKFTTWNAGAERIFGHKEQEILNQDISVIFTPEDNVLGISQKEIVDSMVHGRAQDERWHIRKDHTKFWADGLMMPLNDSLGETLGFLKIVRDRTKYKYIQDQLDAQTAEIKRLEREVDELKKRIG
jgi:PAS domain S-box-containing protein